MLATRHFYYPVAANTTTLQMIAMVCLYMSCACTGQVCEIDGNMWYKDADAWPTNV